MMVLLTRRAGTRAVASKETPHNAPKRTYCSRVRGGPDRQAASGARPRL